MRYAISPKCNPRGYRPLAKKKIPEKYQRWIEARKRYHLTHVHIQMARELGLNLKKVW
jgi:hypothetical protein